MQREKKFKPQLGQVDFSNVRWAPVINCVLKYKNKILVVQRNPSMRLYPGCWNGISGFLDDRKSLEEKVRQELMEEVGLSGKQIISIKLGPIFNQEEPKYKKTWIVHPVLVHLSTNKIKLDWEAANYQWIRPTNAKKLNLVPGFGRTISSALNLK